MKRVIKFFILLMMFYSIVSLAACVETAVAPPIAQATPTSPPETAATPTPPDESDKLVIGAILFQNDNFFETVALGMEDAAKEAGADILFRFHEQDVALETQWIEEFTQQDVDAIVISPRVKDGSVAAIQAAYEAGIKIICYNGCFTEEATEKYVSAVFETDQTALGYQAGVYLAGWLAKRGIEEPHIGIIGCCQRRNAGFRQALADYDVNWHEDANMEGYLADASVAVGETILQENPQITILWSENEGGTVGAVSAVHNQKLAGQVFVFGIDISPQLAQMLLDEDDVLQAVGAQSPRLMGKLAVAAAVDVVHGGEAPGYNTVPAAFFSRDDLDAVAAYLQSQ